MSDQQARPKADRRISVIGPNPAIDHLLEVPGFEAGRVWRATRSLQVAGGKPFNVARVLCRLGMAAEIVAPLGGPLAPRLIGSVCTEMGITLDAVPISGATRTCAIIVDPAQHPTVINESGPRLTPEEVERFFDAATSLFRPGEITLACGSLPPGIPEDFYARLVPMARERDSALIVDSSGVPLIRAIEAAAWTIKVNGDEILAATGAVAVEAAMEEARAAGVRNIVVTRGGEGVDYLGEVGYFHVPAAPVVALNPIGGGDAFLAGLATALARGESWLAALRFASAVAGLAVSQFAPDVGPDPEIDPLFAALSDE